MTPATIPTHTHAPVPAGSDAPRGAFSWSQLTTAAPGAFRKLDPRELWRTPVMFIVWVGAVLTTLDRLVACSNP